MSEKILRRDFPVVENILGCFHSFFRLLSTNKQPPPFLFLLALKKQERQTRFAGLFVCAMNACQQPELCFGEKERKRKDYHFLL